MIITDSHLLIINIILFIALGCSGNPADPASDSGLSVATDDQQIKRHAKTLSPPLDESLPLQEYIEAGMPAYDRSWAGNDMMRAATALKSLTQAELSHLPRYQSERSGEMFQRITAKDNLDFYRNQSLPVQQRLPDVILYGQGNQQILLLYRNAFQGNAVADSEVVELMGGQLRLQVVLLGLMNEFLPTLDENDPTYPARLAGVKQMKNGLATVVSGCLDTLTESHAFRSSELKRFISYLGVTLPVIFPDLPEGSQTETITRLKVFSKEPSMQFLQPELDKLLTAIQ